MEFAVVTYPGMSAEVCNETENTEPEANVAEPHRPACEQQNPFID
jgi:hypothetical protein